MTMGVCPFASGREAYLQNDDDNRDSIITSPTAHLAELVL